VLPFSIAGQPLQPITWRRPQVLEIASIVDLHQLTVRCLYDVGNVIEHRKPELDE
jgi:hypothetical protein